MRFNTSSTGRINSRDNSWIKKDSYKPEKSAEPTKAWDGGSMQEKSKTRQRIQKNEKG